MFRHVLFYLFYAEVKMIDINEETTSEILRGMVVIEIGTLEEMVNTKVGMAILRAHHRRRSPEVNVGLPINHGE